MEIELRERTEFTDVLRPLWCLPLVCLLVEQKSIAYFASHLRYWERPPAFAKTLRKIKWSEGVLECLISYCRHLESIEYTQSDRTWWQPKLDLSNHHYLRQLIVWNEPKLKGECPLLTEILLSTSESGESGLDEFISHCPLLTSVTLYGIWESIIQVTKAIVNPRQCMLNLKSLCDPVSSDVYDLMKRGFKAHPDFPLCVIDVEGWNSALKMVPNYSSLQLLDGSSLIMFKHPQLLTSFPVLSTLRVGHLRVSGQELRTMMAMLPTLTELEMTNMSTPRGSLQLESMSLKLLILSHHHRISPTKGMKWKTPNLTDLSFEFPSALAMVKCILDNCLNLQRVQVVNNPDYESSTKITWALRHPTLQILQICDKAANLQSITVNQVPLLRRFKLEYSKPPLTVDLNVPSSCNLSIQYFQQESEEIDLFELENFRHHEEYHRQGERSGRIDNTFQTVFHIPDRNPQARDKPCCVAQ